MNIEIEKKESNVIRFSATEGGKEHGRAYLYLIRNDLHAEPYGYLEDVFVDESARKQGLGSKLVEAVVAEAKKIGCYKLVATSRESKGDVHAWYEKRGFKKSGFAFRMDF